MSKRTFSECDEELRRINMSDYLKTDSEAPRKTLSFSSLGFRLVVPKHRVSEDPEDGIARLISYMGEIGKFYSCAVQLVVSDDESFYEAIVCFKTKHTADSVRSVFGTAEVFPLTGYKAAFYNFLFNLEGDKDEREGVQILNRKIFGAFACDIEAVS